MVLRLQYKVGFVTYTDLLLINIFHQSLKLFRNKTERNSEIASPPGYNPSLVQIHTETNKESDPNHLIIKKSWDLALGPLKQVCNCLITDSYL